MKNLAYGYAIFTALFTAFIVWQSSEWHPFGLNEAVLLWLQYLLVGNIPLALGLAIAGILKAFKVYKPARVIYILLLFFIAWGYVGCPSSVGEGVFNVKYPRLMSSGADKIDLRDAMMGDWEMVCSSDGYDSGVRIKKFDKLYEPVGYPQDGWWGLIFISPDGSYKGATGHSESVDLRGCVKRDQAIFYKQGDGYKLPDEVEKARWNGEWRMY